MKSIQIFDQALGTAAADLEWARQQGANIEHFILAQQPQVFTDNAVVKAFIERSGQDALPLVLLDGEIALAGRNPTRDELTRWAGIKPTLKPVQSECCGHCS